MMYYIFLSDGGAPNVAEPGVTYPSTPLSPVLFLVHYSTRFVYMHIPAE